MQMAFDNFILAKELIAKALQSLETCVLVNNNLWGKSFSSLESSKIFGEGFKVTSISFFVPDFNLLNCVFDDFTSNVFIVSF